MRNISRSRLNIMHLVALFTLLISSAVGIPMCNDKLTWQHGDSNYLAADFSQVLDHLLGSEATKGMEPERYMEIVAAIKYKIYNHVPICENEREIWLGVQHQLRASLCSAHCAIFVPRCSKAVCCHVLSEETDFGFCLYFDQLMDNPASAANPDCTYGYPVLDVENERQEVCPSPELDSSMGYSDSSGYADNSGNGASDRVQVSARLDSRSKLPCVSDSLCAYLPDVFS